MRLVARTARGSARQGVSARFSRMSFVHLHCHSEYSLLDGANRIDDLIARAQELEQPALAITDHGNMHAAWEFQEKARKAGIKPIIGMEAYVAPGDRRTRGRAGAGRQAVLPSGAAGPRSRRATAISSSSRRSAYTEGFYTQAAHRPGAAGAVSRGADRLVGVHGRRSGVAPHGGPDRRSARGRRSGTPTLFNGSLLPRSAGAHERGAVAS